MIPPREIFQAVRNPQNSYLNPWKGVPDVIWHNIMTHSVWETLLHYLTTLGVLFHWGGMTSSHQIAFAQNGSGGCVQSHQIMLRMLECQWILPTIRINKHISAQGSQEHSRTSH